MDFVKVTFRNSNPEETDVLIATLSGIGFDGFEETEDELYAYISNRVFDKSELDGVVATHNLSYELEKLPAKNWNAVWESNFQPVVVEDFCTVRAAFHKLDVATKYDIVITPKMSFGTGHHATTQLMMLQMRDMNFSRKSVLDFGTGTGILSILAELLGATNVLAIDNDEWPVANTAENIAANHCKHIIACLGSIEVVDIPVFDIILANINRHILLEYMAVLFKKTKRGGQLLVSGLLADDNDIITAAATNEGFHFARLTRAG